jgi:hypothetical protein
MTRHLGSLAGRQTHQFLPARVLREIVDATDDLGSAAVL